MPKRALVLGGTRYVGKRLVERLKENGVSVTVGTRGIEPVPDGVHHLKLDRFDPDSMRAALRHGEWDIVYDQQCYAPEDAAAAIEILQGRVPRYILCSSGIVYKKALEAGEEQFDPFNYPIQLSGRSVDYGEGKRQSEAMLFQRGRFSSVSVRFPIILGPDDFSGRLRVQVRRGVHGQPLKVANPESRISLISSGEAAQFLLWLSEVEFTGPFNACSDGSLALKEIVTLIGLATGKTATIRRQLDDNPFSLFWATSTFTMSPARAQSCGFSFLKTRDWMTSLVEDEANQVLS